MTDFETEANVAIVVRERELRQARQTIEDGIGDVEVGVAGSNGGGGGRPPEMRSDGGSSRQQRRNRREHRWARSRTNDIEDILELLERTDFGGDGGGGLAGGLLDLGGDLGGALAGALPAGIGAAVGSAVGPVISDAISGSELSVGDVEEVPEPEWLPLEVLEPEWELGIEEIAALDVEEPTLGVDAPELSVDDPSPLGVDEPVLEVDDPSPLAVDAPEEIPVEDVGPIEVLVGVGSGSEPVPDADGDSGFEPRTFSELRDDVVERAGIGAVGGATAGGLIGAGAGGVGAIPGAALGGLSGALTGTGSVFLEEGIGNINAALSDQSSQQTGGGSATALSPVNVTNDVTHSPTVSVEVDPRRLDDFADRIVSEIENNLRRELQTLEDDVRNLESDLNNLERGITR